ncbi:MAG TPA: oligosaccharide flippase family protein [Verrucomicrobiae bacterium]|nr:oligosaccharide flippase family protein [Verrucomicrobiae bacterium]
MRALHHTARNFSVVAMAQAITWTATFLFTLAQARYLEPARFGELSLALSYAALLAVVVDFGLSAKVARDVAQRPASARQALMATLVVRVGIWTLAMPAVWATTVLLGYHAELQASILILGGSLLIGGFSASLGAYFQGREEFLVPSLGSIAQRGSAAALGVAALAMGHGIIAVAIAYALASVVQVVVLLLGVRKRPVAFSVPERVAVVDMFRGAAIMGCFWILGTFYYNVDMLILQRLVPLENVAWYAAAYRLFNAAVTLVAFTSGAVLYPVMARLSVGPREELRGAMEKSFTYLLASGVFVALTLVIAADQVVALLYPAREYGEAATALRLLAPALAAMYTNGVFFLALLGMGYERRLVLMAAFLAVLNPIANVLVIPILRQDGAAVVTSLTELIVLIWVLALTPKDLRSAANPATVLRIVAGGAPAAACLWALPDGLFIGVPLAGIVYLATLRALGVIPAADLRALRELVSRPHRGVKTLDTGRVVSPGTAEP